MPQFSNLSDQEMLAIARWIHYSRTQEHFKELNNPKAMVSGDSSAREVYFSKTCSSCHTQTDITVRAKKYDASTLRARALNPPFVSDLRSFKADKLYDSKLTDARDKHGALLEKYTARDVANLITYLQTLK